MKLLGLGLALASAVCWGLTYTLTEKILQKTHSFSIIFIESLLATLITLPLFFGKAGGIKALVGVGTPTLLLLGVSTVTAILGYFFIYESIKLVGASIATFFEVGYPFFVVIFSMLLLGTHINWFCILGGTFICAGVVIIGTFC